MDDIEEMLFAELELPNLQPKEQDQMAVTGHPLQRRPEKRFDGQLDKKRTLLEALKRHRMRGGNRHGPHYAGRLAV